MDAFACLVVASLQALALTRSRDLVLTAAFINRVFIYFVTQYLLLKAYRFFVYPRFLSPLRHMPGPKDNFPLIGQMKNLYTASTPNEMYIKWGNQWPDTPFVRHLGLGNQEMLMVNTPEAHKEVLQTYCYSFVKPEFLFRFVGETVGRGLLFTEGVEHKKQRRMVMGVFSVPNLKRMLSVFQEKAQLLTDLFQDIVDERGVGCIDACSFFSRATMDVTGVTILGVELDNLHLPNQDMDFLQCYNRAFEQGALSSLISFINVYVPIRHLVPLEANHGFIRANDQIKSMLRACIQNRINDIQLGVKGAERTFGRDLLTFMIEERARFAYEGSDVLTDDEILEHLLNFLAGGFETTAGAMTWSSFVLATKPEIQEKLRAEIMDFLQTSTACDYNTMESLPYMNNFCRELLRLYCPAVATYRQATTELTLCGQYIPKGTCLIINPAITNHSEAIWGPTVEEFIPERWNNLGPGAANPYATGTFGHGPRVCIGKHFAMMEFKLLLIEVLSKFRFGMTPQLQALGGKMPEVWNPAVSLRPKGNLMIRIEKIY